MSQHKFCSDWEPRLEGSVYTRNYVIKGSVLTLLVRSMHLKDHWHMSKCSLKQWPTCESVCTPLLTAVSSNLGDSMMRCVPKFAQRTPHVSSSLTCWGEVSLDGSFKVKHRGPEGRATLWCDRCLFLIQERSDSSALERGFLPLNTIHWSQVHGEMKRWIMQIYLEMYVSALKT